MRHALTVDVEDYHSIVLRDWCGVASASPHERVVSSTRRLLELLDRHGASATCFVLGEVAEAFPELVREIDASGHELGVHGYRHLQLHRISPEEFRREVLAAKRVIEGIVGRPVLGHRAPAFSVTPQTRWGLEILADLGFRYDSSVFPVDGRRYGWPGFGKDFQTLSLPGGASLTEVPLSTVRLLGRELPVGGGGYLRHYPYQFTRWALRRIGSGRPAVVYLHPYELDLEPPPADFRAQLGKAPRAARRFHSAQVLNRRTVRGKLERLLEEFSFAPIEDMLAAGS